jgi:stringent starvation protein B
VKSSRPYLLRALYDWILDNDCTPYVVVRADAPGVCVPPGHAKDGRIVLNIAPRSVQGLVIDEAGVRFDARFGGRSFGISAPCAAVIAIYARENGQGMAFEAEPEGTAPAPAPEEPPRRPDGPGLKLVR